MKELVDGTEVSSRGYYFLLDWNDQNKRKVISDLYGVNQQCELNKNQYSYLLKHAMNIDLSLLNDA